MLMSEDMEEKMEKTLPILPTLKDIEQELSGYIKADKSNWARIYKLMNAVDKGKLYLQRPDTPSFTSWVNALAGELHVHVSLLWGRKKAGSVYAEYQERAQRAGKSVPDLETLDASPDSISLCAKVAGRNAVEMDKLIDRVVAGELTREDLRAAARAKRATAVDGEIATSRHNRITAENRTETEEKVTAADVVLALRRADWLPIVQERDYFSHVYRCFEEFRVHTGTSRHARRIDALVAENRTESDKDAIALRGIEIKVDLHDLESDTKMAEYTDYVDYFYIAIPDGDEEMLEVARQIIRPVWGIMLVSKAGTIRVEKEPERLEGIMRDKTLSTAIIKLLAE